MSFVFNVECLNCRAKSASLLTERRVQGCFMVCHQCCKSFFLCFHLSNYVFIYSLCSSPHNFSLRLQRVGRLENESGWVTISNETFYQRKIFFPFFFKRNTVFFWRECMKRWIISSSCGLEKKKKKTFLILKICFKKNNLLQDFFSSSFRSAVFAVEWRNGWICEAAAAVMNTEREGIDVQDASIRLKRDIQHGLCNSDIFWFVFCWWS